MAITDEGGGTGMYMPVAPAYGGGGGFGSGFGGDWAWIILLLVLCGGWNNGFGGGFGGGGDLYPWMNNSQNINEGFRDQMLNTQITSIGDKLVSGQFDAMQNSFALQSQLSSCCFENRLATVETQNVVQAEGAATRAAIQSQTQAILDKMCQQEIDSLKARNLELQNQLNMANLAASQIAQTGQIVDQTYNRLSTCPVGTVPVYGETPIFRCNNGCGCGGNTGGFNGNF